MKAKADATPPHSPRLTRSTAASQAASHPVASGSSSARPEKFFKGAAPSSNPKSAHGESDPPRVSPGAKAAKPDAPVGTPKRLSSIVRSSSTSSVAPALPSKTTPKKPVSSTSKSSAKVPGPSGRKVEVVVSPRQLQSSRARDASSEPAKVDKRKATTPLSDELPPAKRVTRASVRLYFLFNSLSYLI